MVTEYIKRGQKMGYDEEGTLVYKIPVSEPSPVEVAAEPADEEMPPLNLV